MRTKDEGSEKPPDRLSEDDLPTQPPEATVGPCSATPEIPGFRILGPLGLGAMGLVYLAEQQSPRRKVALKVIRGGFATPELRARFAQEAEVLGLLQHPGIAQIYQAGTAGSASAPLPFFAMEHVQGLPLVEHADEARLGPRQRLALFAQICDAVDYAHRRGVVHRDLKPSNILVDQDGQSRILDFGIARATDADLAVTTLLTDVGQVVGTVPYMSPEQASGDPSRLDRRSDVYSLGVVAYELLTGRLPYELTGMVIHEAVRMIREQEPERLGRVDRALAGDIETIVGKAMAKERGGRYQSAGEMGADVRRYLDNEPIAARSPSAIYQLRKFARRNRALVASTAAVFVSLVVATTVSLAFAVRAEQARALAVVERDRAESGRRLAVGERLLEDQPTLSVAHAIAALELADSEEARTFALRALSREAPASVLQPFGREATSLRFSDDGRTLVGGGSFGGVIWDDAGRRSRTLEGIGEPAVRVAVADGLMTTLGFRSNRIARWRLKDATRLDFADVGPPINVAAGLVPDGRHQLTASLDDGASVATLSRIGGGAERERRFAFPLAPWGIALRRPGEVWPWVIDRDLNRLVWGHQKEVFIVPLAEMESAEATLVGAHSADVFNLAMSGDGRRLVSLDVEGGLRLWDLSGQDATRSLDGPAWPAVATLSRDGNSLAVGSILDHTLTLWDLKGPPDAAPLVQRVAEVGGFLATEFHPRGDWLVVGTHSGAIAMPWGTPRSRVIQSGDRAVWGTRFTPSGLYIVSHGQGHRIVVWPLAAHLDKKRVLAPSRDRGGRSSRPDVGLAVDPSGRFAVSGAEDGRVRVLQLDGSRVRLLGRFASGVGDVAIDAEGRMVAASGAMDQNSNWQIRLWDLGAPDTAARVLKGPAAVRVHQLRFLSAQSLVSVGQAGLVVWNLADGTDRELRPRGAFRAAADASGRVLAVANGQTVEVVDVDSGRPRPQPGHASASDISALAVDPAGRNLASGNADGVIRVGPVDGAPHLLFGHTAYITHIEFSPDGKLLSSSDLSGTIRLWRVPSGRPTHRLPRDQLLSRLRNLTNVRVVRNENVAGGFETTFEPFQGWDRNLTW